MRDKLLQIRVDEEFLNRLEWLRKIHGFKTISETVRHIIDKEWRKEKEEVLEMDSIRQHATWIEVDDDRVRAYCSCCGWKAILYESDVFGENFCPHCGAKMDNASPD